MSDGSQAATEDLKIRNVVEQYSGYFQDSNVDVGHTVKGDWFIYEYDREYDEYSSFFKFETAEELRRILSGIIGWSLKGAVDTAVQAIYSKSREADIENARLSSYDTCIPKLLKELEIIKMECLKCCEQLDIICRAFTEKGAVGNE